MNVTNCAKASNDDKIIIKNELVSKQTNIFPLPVLFLFIKYCPKVNINNKQNKIA